MDRVWLLTWTMYGNWLPGDQRGSVTTVQNPDTARIRHNQPQTPYDPGMSGLHRSATELLKGSVIRFTAEQANLALDQMKATANYRNWQLLAAAIMTNHLHLVVGVNGDPDPSYLIRDFKSYAARVLNKKYGQPASGTWWTQSGSRRKLANAEAVQRGIRYVRNQERPLVIYVSETVEQLFGELPP